MSEGFFRIYQTEDEILIHNTIKSKIISILKMDRLNTNSQPQSQFHFNPPKFSYKDLNYLNSLVILQVFKAHGVLGILNIGSFEILIFISNKIKVGSIGNTEIYEIKEVDCILISQFNGKTFDRKFSLNSDAGKSEFNSEEISLILENLKNLFKKGFYYSHNYDLTNSLQIQKIKKINNNNCYDFIQDANSDFLWNFSLNKSFLENKIDNDFMVNVIYGYIGIINDHQIQLNQINQINPMKINYILISRRNFKNFSVKNSSLISVDQDGNCQNFIETEAIVIQGQNVFSYVQVRGLTPLNLDNFNFEERMRQMQQHIECVLAQRNFKLMFSINLLSNDKYEEKTLTDAFERLIQTMNLKNLKYSYFDVEKECQELMSEIRGMENNSCNNDLLGLFGGSTNHTNHNISNYPSLVQDKRNSAWVNNQNLPNLSSTTHLAAENLEKFLNKIEGISSIFKFFAIFVNTEVNQFNQINTNKQMWDQVGVIRTSCHDCLEKTNYIQMRIAWRVLSAQMKLINPNFDIKSLFGDISVSGNEIVNREGHSKSVPSKDSISVLSEIFAQGTSLVTKDRDHQQINSINSNFQTSNSNPDPVFLKSYKRLWYENGVKLAIQYLGEEDEDYMLLSEESMKQKCMDILLNRYKTLKVKENNENFQNFENFSKKESDFTNDWSVSPQSNSHLLNSSDYEELSIFIGTWNVAGQTFKDEISLFDWLYPRTKLKRTPDIYCIGLQEIVELNANYLLLSSNQHKVEYWRNTFQLNLDGIDKYTMIKCLDLVGVFMILFIKTPLKDKIKNFDCHIIKTGLMGAMGNKGSCLVRFDYLDTSFAFSSGHFAAGSSANSSRISELTEVLNKNFPIHKIPKFKDHNIMFVFGDLNFRCDIDYQSCLNLIKAKNLPQLLQYDQFLKSKEVNFSLIDVEEGEIKFNPTFKYTINTQDYDSKKKRVPSWCDRILFKKSKFAVQNLYERAEYTYSDHRPVYSEFTCYAMKDQLRHKKSLKNFKMMNSDELTGVKSGEYCRQVSSMKKHEENEVKDVKDVKTPSFNFRENKNSEKRELTNYASEEIINFFK